MDPPEVFAKTPDGKEICPGCGKPTNLFGHILQGQRLAMVVQLVEVKK